MAYIDIRRRYFDFFMVNKVVFLFLLSIAIIGCGNSTRYVIWSTDRKNCITIITEGKIRYIVEGENNSDIPLSNFIKLDLRNVDHQMGDEIVGC